jgi:hypothetical protein
MCKLDRETQQWDTKNKRVGLLLLTYIEMNSIVVSLLAMHVAASYHLFFLYDVNCDSQFQRQKAMCGKVLSS